MKRKTDWWVWVVLIMGLMAGWHDSNRITALERDVQALKGQKLAIIGPGYANEQRLLRNWCGKNTSDLNELKRDRTAKAVVALGGMPEAFRSEER
jgi:hypothetical protein